VYPRTLYLHQNTPMRELYFTQGCPWAVPVLPTCNEYSRDLLDGEVCYASYVEVGESGVDGDGT
jgi:hypothetical protein